MRARTRAALALAAGAVLALGAPPLQWWPSTFVALLLFGTSIDGAGPKVAAMSGWIAGTAATLASFYWIVGTVVRFGGMPLAAGVLAYVLLCAFTGLTLGAAGAVAAWCTPTVGAPIALGLGVIIAERYVPGIFHWQLAAPLVFAPAVPQSADLVGVSVLGAILVAVMMISSRWIRWGIAHVRGQSVARPDSRHGAAAVAILVAIVTYGAIRTRVIVDAMRVAPRVRIVLVQPNIGALERWDESNADAILIGLHDQTHAALAGGGDLVIWPEASYPFTLPHAAGIDGVGAPPVYPVPAAVPILFGAITEDAQGHKYNSALIREPDGGLSAPVDKRVLVPFGEYVPVLGRIAWVRHAFARAEGITPGDRRTILRTGSGLSLGVLNCFEDTLSGVAADLSGADLLVNVTNDAWFGSGAAPWSHLMLARWRAIETGRELVRAVNTGVTGRVDPLGVLEDRAPTAQTAVLYTDARRMRLRTLAPFVIVYAPPAALLAAAVATAYSVRRARRARM